MAIPFNKRTPKFATQENPEVLDLSYRIEGERSERIKIAKRHLALKKEFPAITLPESIVYFYLEIKGIPFEYQQQIYGGRIELGGKLPDFWIPDRQIVLEILGDYWHSSKEARDQDFVRSNAILNSEINGAGVEKVVELWESTLLSKDRERAVELALIGVEVPRVPS